MKFLYDEIYTNNPKYNDPIVSQSELKYKYVSKFINGKTSILDAGCGSGFNLKRMVEEEYLAYGIEHSQVCCDMFLKELPHECCSIVSFANKNKKCFDAVICCDVLEHINKEELELNIESLVSLSKCALYGIANHSDVQFGHELHLIQENEEWWINCLTKFYKNVNLACKLFGDKFFFIECSN